MERWLNYFGAVDFQRVQTVRVAAAGIPASPFEPDGSREVLLEDCPRL